MSQLGNSIVRGIGFTIGRQVVQGTIRTVERAAQIRIDNINAANFKASNSKLNSILNTSVFDKLLETVNSDISYFQNEIASTTKKYGLSIPEPKKKVIIISLFTAAFFTAIGILAITKGMYFGIVAILAGMFFLIGSTGGKRLKQKGLLKIKEIEEKITKYQNLNRDLNDSLNDFLDIISKEAGPEMADNFENRKLVMGMPLRYFKEPFFDEPDFVEQSIKNGHTYDTLIYGTSKQAGDWIKFKDGLLYEYSVK